ncbi:DNA polymerase III subunit gamma/tau [Robiginitalea marina]|uniref:DNA polymerase III subunit gamma/tau n=1 Tax=Robiginitalea marina TaxID=2954105 RepID=A0ABT1AVS7_9FLAO|nr:DNA polymerase III subunit gamma/tau [Robiginitalea marina]MCO5723794.1 DNA polymerase III subunit gamma/tau [Robiginitalea marina]
MEPFIVSARKYRPQHFEDVVGQEAITRTLTSAIENNHLAQALLFCGPRGVGKTTCARILAKKINEDGSQKEGEDFAFNIFELDAASNNSVDDIRNLIDQVRIPPQVGKYKVYIIDEVHMLSQAAFNAFLKTLEEPPRHAIFILATTEKHKIIPTILSRCQIFDFRRITVGDAVKYLQYIAQEQGITAEEDALHIIAQKADGAMRDALSIFDRVVSFAGTTLTRKAVAENLNVLDVEVYFRVTDLILGQDIPGLLLYFNQVLSSGFEGHHFISGLGSHFRDLMVCRDPQTVSLLETSDNIKKQYLDQSRLTDSDFLLQALELTTQCELNYKASSNHRLLVELCLMQLASLGVHEKKKGTKAVPLIPASQFRGQERQTPASPSNEAPTRPEPSLKEDAPAAEAAPDTPAEPEKRPKKPAIAVDHLRAEKVSALSLSSIRAKKLHEAQKKAHLPAEEALPEDAVPEEDLVRHWETFTHRMEENGRKILASSLAMDRPKLKEDCVIWIELPNLTMKKEVEREQQELMGYLKKTLNNYSLQLRITVNEETARQFAFTPEEKYQKLREKNPALDLLRKTFDLDL